MALESIYFKYRAIFKVIRVELNIFKTKYISQHILNSAIKNKYFELQITL